MPIGDTLVIECCSGPWRHHHVDTRGHGMGLTPQLSEPRTRPRPRPRAGPGAGQLNYPDPVFHPGVVPTGRGGVAAGMSASADRTECVAGRGLHDHPGPGGAGVRGAGSGVRDAGETARAEARHRLAVTRAARRGHLPDPRPVAGELAQALVEVLAGDRPVTQLCTRFDGQTYEELAARAPDPAPGPRMGSARTAIPPWQRPRIRSVHLSRPADGVAEVTTRVQTNGRSRAVALRLEEWQGRWRCSALDVG